MIERCTTRESFRESLPRIFVVDRREEEEGQALELFIE